MFDGALEGSLLGKGPLPALSKKGMILMDKHYDFPPLSMKVFFSVRTKRSFRATFLDKAETTDSRSRWTL
jgi:hypothetical protein